jgi:hypothetical protein
MAVAFAAGASGQQAMPPKCGQRMEMNTAMCWFLGLLMAKPTVVETVANLDPTKGVD